MKKILTIFFLISVVNLFSKNSNEPVIENYARNNFDTLKVFVSVTQNNETIYSKVKTAINSLTGISYYCYCSNHAVFMIYVDKTFFPTADLFLEQIVKRVPEYTSLISIKNGEFRDIVGTCVTSGAGEASAIKKDFGK